MAYIARTAGSGWTYPGIIGVEILGGLIVRKNAVDGSGTDAVLIRDSVLFAVN